MDSRQIEGPEDIDKDWITGWQQLTAQDFADPCP